jgi:hypothetical protein
MKVQKIISLTPKTALLASELENFSEFVRECLLHAPEYKDINHEVISRIKWRRTCDFLAQTILELYADLGIEHDRTVESLVMDAYSQTRLEDYE